MQKNRFHVLHCHVMFRRWLALRWSQCQCLRRISASLGELKYQHDDTTRSLSPWERGPAVRPPPLWTRPPLEPLHTIVVRVSCSSELSEGRSSLCHKCIPSTGDANCSLRASCESLCESDSDIFPERGLGPRERSVSRSEKKTPQDRVHLRATARW